MAIFFHDRICDNTIRFLIRSDSLHDLAVEMPTRMCDDWQHEDQANESQQEPNHELCGKLGDGVKKAA